MKTTLESFERC